MERGGVIRSARLSYEVHGQLNDARDNVVVYPCSYTATAEEQSWLIGPEGILDPTRWCIVVPDMFSNGRSSSAADTGDWPAVVTMGDNVEAQHRLVVDHLGATRVGAYGFSMGAGQSYHWAARHPEVVDRAVIVCGSARTSDHNKVFLSGLLRTLEAAPEHLGGGRFSTRPAAALRAFGHIYAGWGLSQDFYRQGLYRSALGSEDLDAFLRDWWEAGFALAEAANLYAQAVTWHEADISGGGDLAGALAAISARVTLVPSATDLYFRVADNEAELEHLAHGELAVIPSVFGHMAGSPQGLEEESAFLRDVTRRALGD